MSTEHADNTIVKEIEIKAPAERIFEALSEPGQRVQWWGAPGRFQATEMESDLRPGGQWAMRGTGMGGAPFTVRGEYLRVERPRLLEMTWLADWHENTGPSVVRFELEEKVGGTTVRLIHSGLATGRTRENYQGWPWLLALLRGYVEASGGAG